MGPFWTGIFNRDDGYTKLGLTTAGRRGGFFTGDEKFAGTGSYYWSRSTSIRWSRTFALAFDVSNSVSIFPRAQGLSVRCIKKL